MSSDLLSGKRVDLVHRTKIVGILNITPDSMSDGGKYLAPDKAIEHANCLIKHGADVIDVGAESTRPFAVPISHDEEKKRLEPVLPHLVAIAHEHSVEVSVDTYHYETAEMAVENGVDYINDVSGGVDDNMLSVMSDAVQGFCAMHSLVVPVDKSVVFPSCTDVISHLSDWGARVLERFEKRGISSDRVVLDPGLGFGKTPSQCWMVLKSLEKLQLVHKRWLVGHSRKTFLNPKISNPNDRDVETIVLSVLLAQKGVEFLRVHNVFYHMKALRTLERCIAEMDTSC